MTKRAWITVPDDMVRSIWKCTIEDCHEYNNEVSVEQTFFSEMGTPICEECDVDLEYVRTEVEV